MADNWDDDVGLVDGHPGNMSHDQVNAPHMHHQPQSDLQPSVALSGFAVRIRGIPFQESEHTVHKWLQERGVTVRNGVMGIHFVYSEKRQWSGDAWASLESEKDLEVTLGHDQAQMNHRYLEIFAASNNEMEEVLKRTGYYRLPNDYTIRLRGLEYKVTREHIQDFFKGLDIASGLDGIFIIKSHDGRTTGEAYVLFENKAAVKQAVQKHKQKMGDRYVEIFLASSAHLRDALAGDGGRSRGRDLSGYGRGGQTQNREDEYGGYPRGGPELNNDPQADHYPGFYPPNDSQYGASRDSYAPPGKGGNPNYEHGPPAQAFGEPGFRLYMRGLPWTCDLNNIEKFFGEIKPLNFTKNMSDSNVFDGSAWVEFSSEVDLAAAKLLHKTSMGHRYVELFTEQEVEDKRLGTSTGRLKAPRNDRGGRSVRGGREGASGRGGGDRHGGVSRGGANAYRGGGNGGSGGQSDYGRVGHAGPRTPYDRPLQYQPHSSGFSAYSVRASRSPAASGYSSYTSFQHQPRPNHSSAPSYGGNGAGGPYGSNNTVPPYNGSAAPMYSGNGSSAPFYPANGGTGPLYSGNGGTTSSYAETENTVPPYTGAATGYGYPTYSQYPAEYGSPVSTGANQHHPPQHSGYADYPETGQQYAPQRHGLPQNNGQLYGQNSANTPYVSYPPS